MRKQWNKVLNLIMGGAIGIFVGYALLQIRDYKTNPQIYMFNSAPWYTGILVYGAMTLGVLALCAVVKWILKYRDK